MTFSTGLVGVEVSSVSLPKPGPTRPTRLVENVIVMTKGLQERNTTLDGTR